MSDGILFGILYGGEVLCFFVVIAEINITMKGFDSCDSCFKFIEHKNEDGSLLTVDTGERCLGFCEDLDPDDKVYKVQENLFISSQDGAQNMEELRRNNITHILNVGTGIKNAFPEVVLKICCQWFSFQVDSGISDNLQECVCMCGGGQGGQKLLLLTHSCLPSTFLPGSCSLSTPTSVPVFVHINKTTSTQTFLKVIFSKEIKLACSQ